MKCEVHPGRVEFGCVRCEGVRRADAWSQWIAHQADWDLFGGLTFDPRRRPTLPPGAARVSRLDRVTRDELPRRPDVSRLAPRLSEDGRLRLQGRPLAVDVARRSALAFFKHGEELLGRRLSGVIALEYHRNGWPHFHPLIAVQGGLQKGDIAALGRLWYQQSGGNKLEQPRSVGDVCAYASKYLSKGLDQGDVLIWPAAGPLSRTWRLSVGAVRS